MMRPLSAIFVMLLVSLLPLPAVADITLNDYGFNIDGTTTLWNIYDANWGTVPAGVNASAFDFTQGLGTITITLNPGSTHHYIAAFFNNDLGLPFDVDSGSAHGIPAAALGQTWEIDEPGYGNLATGYLGDIVNPNLRNGTLDNKILDGTFDGPEDLSMALAWDFNLSDTEQAVITLTLTTSVPPDHDFFLQQTGNNNQIDFFGRVDMSTPDGTNVPEPAAWGLMGTVVALLAWKRRLRSARD